MGQYYKPVSLEKLEYVYSHDYGNGLKLMEHSYIGNDFVAVVENLIKKGGAWHKDRIVWAGDYAEPEPNSETNIYRSMEDENKIQPEPKIIKNLRFLKNLDTNEYVSLSKVPSDSSGYRIHPLPLLCCEGNGEGGGDFFGKDENKLIGRWARNRVVIQSHRPKNCTEIIFDLVEN